MKGKAVSGTLILLLIGMLTLAFDIQPARTSGTIYIRPDGSVEGTDKIHRDGDLYTLTDNIYDGIVVERSNIVVDGAGYTLQRTGSTAGFDLSHQENVTIKNTNIIGFSVGVYLYESRWNSIVDNSLSSSGVGVYLGWWSYDNNVVSNLISDSLSSGISISSSTGNNIQGNIITSGKHTTTRGLTMMFGDYSYVAGNIITHNPGAAISLSGVFSSSFVGNTLSNNGRGIETYDVLYCKIAGNTISHNIGCGIWFGGETTKNTVSSNCLECNNIGIVLGPGVENDNNIIVNNAIADNNVGLEVGYGFSNFVFHNNFTANLQQVHVEPAPPSPNYWDDGYPSGGNFWSDYTGIDLHSGPYQNLTGSDGIGDTPHVMDDGNVDHYPLITPYGTVTYVLTITTTTGGTTDPSPGTYVHTAGSLITVEALPQTYYTFDHWELDNVNIGSANPISVTMDANHALHAVFTRVTPQHLTQKLIETIKTWNLPEGTESSLTSKLEEAILLINKGNENGATHKLIDLINQVGALRNKGKMEDWQADYLVTEAQKIIDFI